MRLLCGLGLHRWELAHSCSADNDTDYYYQCRCGARRRTINGWEANDFIDKHWHTVRGVPRCWEDA